MPYLETKGAMHRTNNKQDEMMPNYRRWFLANRTSHFASGKKEKMVRFIEDFAPRTKHLR